jgi:cellulose synthase/poly-beta-1,6-N-acetylglucosamine synthase-like glycosyltransferase
MSQPLVSVVVPSMNRADYLRATIESILAQDYPRIECIVMDGGSRDGTVDILRQYDGRIEWVSERDKGQADAIDRGLRKSQGDICAWLNADDIWWTPSAVSAVVAEFERRPSADVIYGDCRAIDANGNLIGDSYGVQGWDLRYAIEQADHCIPQPSAFIRRRALERVGFLDTSLIFMDRDLWLRIGLKGEICHVPTYLAAARTHATYWHVRYRRAAEEWIATSERILNHPDFPKRLGIRKSVAMANACLKAMQYAWIGKRLGETFMIGARAMRYRPAAIVGLARNLWVYASESDHWAASLLRVARAIWRARMLVSGDRNLR